MACPQNVSEYDFRDNWLFLNTSSEMTFVTSDFSQRVGDEDFRDALRCMLIYLLNPVRYIVKRVLFSAVIDEHNAHRTLIVTLRDCAESFLTGCVPNLKDRV